MSMIENGATRKITEIVYRIINNRTGEAEGSYSRGYCDEFDFKSASQARNANCNGMFKNKKLSVHDKKAPMVVYTHRSFHFQILKFNQDSYV